MGASSGHERTVAGRTGAAAVLSRDGRRRYAAVGFLIGLVNLVLMMTLIEPASPVRLVFLILALLTLTAVPLRPMTGAAAYLVLWVVLLRFPGPHFDDLTITNAALFFFLGRFLPLRAALGLGSAVLIAGGLLAAPRTVVVELLFFSCTLPPGALLQHKEITLRREVSAVRKRLDAVRAEIARDMHDLVAYSMSQTVLRARRAAADPPTRRRCARSSRRSVPPPPTRSTSCGLVLRALRRTEAGTTLEASSGSPDTMVVDLDAALQAVADDLSASGFTVTLRSSGAGECPRLQAVTLSRVAREMGANILRHGALDKPVTITLAKEKNQVRLITTNGISSSPAHRLPTSGAGLLGMRERLSAVDGSLSTLEADGSWIASATVPLAPPAPTQETPS